MSWQYVALAAKAVGTGMEIAGAYDEAKAAEVSAEMDRMQYQENARMAKIEAASEEGVRLEKLRFTQAAARAAQSAGAMAGESFGALQNKSRSSAFKEIGQVRLLGRSKVGRAKLGEAAAGVAANQARTAQRWSWVKPTAKLVGYGATQADAGAYSGGGGGGGGDFTGLSGKAKGGWL